MRVGFPNNPRKNILDEIKWIGENGFDFVDLFLEEDMAVPGKIDVDKAKTLLREYRLGAVGHTACYLPIGSPIKSLRDAAVFEAVKYLELFNRLGVENVTVHANWPPGMFSYKEGIKWQLESLARLSKEAGRYNINLMYEPIDTLQDNAANLARILNDIPNLYLTLDLGHTNLFGKNIEEFIKEFHKRLKHVHLHDNDGRRDLHLPIGTGNINWEKVLKVLKRYYDGTITLEVFSMSIDGATFPFASWEPSFFALQKSHFPKSLRGK